MAKILVTGGAGYIGSVLVPMLLNKGHEVIVLDNFMYDQNSLLDCCNSKKLTIVRGDTRDEKLIYRLSCDYPTEFVFPLAAIVGAPACDKDPITSATTNVDGVLEASQQRLTNKKWFPKIIFPNTNSGYGIGQKETYCTENSPLKPIPLYGRQKVKAEKLVLKMENTIVLRLATVFGISPRM